MNGIRYPYLIIEWEGSRFGKGASEGKKAMGGANGVGHWDLHLCMNMPLRGW